MDSGSCSTISEKQHAEISVTNMRADDGSFLIHIFRVS